MENKETQVANKGGATAKKSPEVKPNVKQEVEKVEVDVKEVSTSAETKSAKRKRNRKKKSNTPLVTQQAPQVTTQVKTEEVSPVNYRELFVERKTAQFKDIVENDVILLNRLETLIMSHKHSNNIPVFIDAAKPSRFLKRRNGEDARDAIGEKIPFRYKTEATIVSSDSGKSIVNWIKDIEDIQKSILETSEFIPGISKQTLTNGEERQKNLDKATKLFTEYKTLLGKAGALIEQIKELGFTSKNLKEVTETEEGKEKESA
jgi:hypothetical protein